MAVNIDKFVSGVIGVIVAVKGRKSSSSHVGFGLRNRYSDYRYPDHIVQSGRINCYQLREYECNAEHHSSAYHRWSHHGGCGNFPLHKGKELMRLSA